MFKNLIQEMNNSLSINEDEIAPFDEWIRRYNDRIGLFGGIDVDMLCQNSYDEIFEVAKVAVSMGVDKIRITGGEPLVRKNIVDSVFYCPRGFLFAGSRDEHSLAGEVVKWGRHQTRR